MTLPKLGRAKRGVRAIPPLADRFWSKVQMADGCWIWTGAKTTGGYGHISRDGRRQRAHRVSWELHHGAIPPGLQVCHACDNPQCVRPDHLWLGTNSENQIDSSSKRRKCMGERHRSAKLTAEIVRSIRAEVNSGVMQRDVAAKHGVDPTAVSQIMRGKTWKHV